MTKKHLSAKPPYWSTTIPATRSKIDIEEMLKEFGAKALRWTETPESMRGIACPILEFILEVELKGVKKEIGVMIQPPLLTEGKRRYGKRGPLIHRPNINASMRMLYWYLKSRMEASLYGMEDTFETFMSKIMMSLPDGTAISLGKAMVEKPEIFSQILPTFEIKHPKLVEKEIQEADVVD